MTIDQLRERIEQRLAMLEAGSSHVDLVELAADIRSIVPPDSTTTRQALEALGCMVPAKLMPDGRRPEDVLQTYIQLTGRL